MSRKQLQLTLPLLLFFACTQERDNPYDPGGESFAPLVKPAAFSATPLSPTSIRLKWADSNSRKEGFVIKKGTDPSALVRLTLLPTGDFEFVDDRCSSYTDYYYKLGVYDKLEDTVWFSDIVPARSHFLTPTEQSVNPVLVPPKDLDLTRLAFNVVEFRWDSEDPGREGFVVWSGKNRDTLDSPRVLSSSADTFRDTLDLDTLHYYAVQTFDSTGLPTLVFDSISPMIPPNNLYLNLISGKEIRVVWSGNEKATDSILVERSLDNPTDFSERARLAVGTTNYLDTNLTSFSTYYYRVRSFSGTVFSSVSNFDSLSVKMVRAAASDSNTILFLRFDENSGDTLLDASPNKFHGSKNTAGRISGKFGGALQVSPGNFAFSAANFLFSDSSLFVEFWIKPNTHLTKGSALTGILEARKGPFRVYYSDGKLTASLINTDTTAFDVSAEVSFLPNQWTHVGLSYSGGSRKLFVDGELKSLVVKTLVLMPVSDTVFLGRASILGENRFFSGNLDEFRIKSEPEDFFK